MHEDNKDKGQKSWNGEFVSRKASSHNANKYYSVLLKKLFWEKQQKSMLWWLGYIFVGYTFKKGLLHIKIKMANEDE